MKASALLCLCLLHGAVLLAQQDTSFVLAGPLTRKYADKVEAKAGKVEEGLTRQSEKALRRLQKQQQKVYAALHKLDSNAAQAYLQNSRQQYEATLDKLKDKSTAALGKVKTYVPGLDSATGVLKYLDGLAGKLPGKDGLPGSEKLGSALASVGGAGAALDKAAEVKKLMQQQQAQLRALAARYQDLHIAKQLKAYNKELYYYSQRIQGAKEMLNNPERIEKEVLNLLGKNTTFKNWMQRNGQLAQLFGPPAGATASTQNLAGLQTRQSVQQLLQSRLGGSPQQVQQLINTNLQQAQAQLSSARNRLQQLGAGSIGNGSGDVSMPDFKPNNQKTKTFLQRLEYGANVQSTGRNRWLPATTDIGLSVGYKLNDKSVIGAGAAYKLGWGAPIKDIHFSHQGIGLRSYVDYKLKGSLWLSGGYEMNHRSAFSSIAVLRDYSVWQRSGLVGVSKKIRQGKRTIETKLLWDFLSYQQIPPTQHILFRVEYKLK